MGEIKHNDLDCRDTAPLSKGVFKRRTSTRSEAFSFIIDILRPRPHEDDCKRKR